LEFFMEELDIAEVRVSERGLRDGLFIDYLTRNDIPSEKSQSIRKKSILRLGRSCGIDENHSNTVARLALNLFDTAQKSGMLNWELKERELLEYAALIHDIGIFLSYTNHQAHTYYLTKNADLLGFDQEEISTIATIAFYHHKSLPRPKHPEFALLDKSAQKVVLQLSTLLKLAESLDRSHSSLVSAVQLFDVNGQTAILEITCKDDCQLELWGLQKHTETFKQVFQRNLTIVTNPEKTNASWREKLVKSIKP
jgi:exopolyphosphatase / guanosine-5'-triphosphate,3'-diphosphate pyrophosphatase